MQVKVIFKWRQYTVGWDTSIYKEESKLKKKRKKSSDLRLQEENLFTFRINTTIKKPPQYVGSFEFLKQIVEVVIEQSVHLEK